MESYTLGAWFFEVHTRCSMYQTFILFFFFNLFLAALGLCCCVQAFSSCGERGLLFAVVHWLLTAVASPVAELGL